MYEVMYQCRNVIDGKPVKSWSDAVFSTPSLSRAEYVFNDKASQALSNPNMYRKVRLYQRIK